MKSESAQAVIGRRARDIRDAHGLSQEAVARSARAHGLKWSAARIGELERGQLSVSISTLLAFAKALNSLAGEPRRLSDLFDDDALVNVLGRAYPSREVGAVMAGGSLRRLRDLPEQSAPSPLPTDGNDSLTNYRAAQRLGLSTVQVKELAHSLFGRSLAEERDARAGSRASAQQRGVATRELVSEMRTAVERRG